MSIIPQNNYTPEQLQAFDEIANTNNCICIFGKPGSGKTTFIKKIQEDIHKNFLILAPTGLAALAIGGQTIHSFFGFPIETIGPHTDLHVRISTKEVLEHVDSIIIDEVSMLRCDIVDGIDRCLKSALDNKAPFGGKQIIFTGDLFQLPPVVKKNSADELMLRDLYGSGIPFFYKANVLKSIELKKYNFTKSFRQTNDSFIHILDEIRTGEINDSTLEILNRHISPTDSLEKTSIILTSLNKKAEEINDARLTALHGDAIVYQGIHQGIFNATDFPVPEHLRLKIGAKVIFCRNSYTGDYTNGTIGTIIKMDEESLEVELESGNRIIVSKMTWENFERRYNPKRRKLESKSIGSFTQFPIKLAWAITIHKAQGMTFDRMHLDISRGMYIPGQTYVAISRLRSLEGLTINKPLKSHYIKVNNEVKDFMNFC